MTGTLVPQNGENDSKPFLCKVLLVLVKTVKAGSGPNFPVYHMLGCK